MNTNEPLSNRPTTLAGCATLACLWEATAAKPGNVHRGADFDDITYVDFLTSAAIAGPILGRAAELGVGPAVLAGIEATRAAVNSNTNLGILLLIAPLAACGNPITPRRLENVLVNLSADDTRAIYQAIAMAKPGGLGTVDEADVNDSAPGIPLVEAMRLAEQHDLVARQYVNNFEHVFEIAAQLTSDMAAGIPANDAIVSAFLRQLSSEPDSLIARKCGTSTAQDASLRAAAVLAAEDRTVYQAALADFDFWLRADGHRRNPGTTADLLAAALFVVLAENRLSWPVPFYS